jgi:hypothetical protein
MKLWKLEGIGISFALSYLIYTGMMVIVAFRLTGFRWSSVAVKILVLSALILTAILCCNLYLPDRWSIPIGLGSTVVVGGASLLALQKLLGFDLIRKIKEKFRPAQA